MTIPYLPGWWDEISKSATGFVQQLPQHIQPERVAQRKLEEMIRQDPTVLSKLGNMDDSTRALFEQTMRLTPGTVTGLAPGYERQLQEEERNAVASLTPDQQSARVAARAGVPMQEDINYVRTTRNREQEKFDLDLQSGKLNLEILTSTAAKAKRTEALVQEGLAKFGTVDGMNISTLVRDFVRSGKNIDPLQALVIGEHPGAAALFDAAYKLELQNMQNEAQQRLARMKDPNESMIFLRSLTEYGNQMNDAESRLISDINNLRSNSLMLGEDGRQQMAELNNQLAAVRASRLRNSKITEALTQSVAKASGMDINSVLQSIEAEAPAPAPGPQAQNDPERMKRLRAALGLP